MQTTFEIILTTQNVQEVNDAIHWCEENTPDFDYGVPLVGGCIGPFLVYSIQAPFYFFNETDAIHFKLRWSDYL
ncbi:hypothetical protein AWB76_00919 [Caballeronia temeraria]|uniref:Uncharacterized protein n=1 Tax=Caballeronia temeraria TaxID=1777137 RepID=A0A157ZLS0_9BURK|nr:hypothetical protein [Caballeronia temeraria]SAK46472.1 hypothetical protein AWB76_00919 [Caballeronia temeraria]